jgi:hypothetical protein
MSQTDALSTEVVPRFRQPVQQVSAGCLIKGNEVPLEQDPSGDYVRWTDYESLLAENDRLERASAEWSGIAAQRNRNIALIAEERDRYRAEAESLRKAVEAAGAIIECPNCVIEAAAGRTWCRECGHSLPAQADVEAPLQIGDNCPTCKSCFIGKQQNSLRCSNCGWTGPYTPKGG